MIYHMLNMSKEIYQLLIEIFPYTMFRQTTDSWYIGKYYEISPCKQLYTSNSTLWTIIKRKFTRNVISTQRTIHLCLAIFDGIILVKLQDFCNVLPSAHIVPVKRLITQMILSLNTRGAIQHISHPIHNVKTEPNHQGCWTVGTK